MCIVSDWLLQCCRSGRHVSFLRCVSTIFLPSCVRAVPFHLNILKKNCLSELVKRVIKQFTSLFQLVLKVTHIRIKVCISVPPIIPLQIPCNWRHPSITCKKLVYIYTHTLYMGHRSIHYLKKGDRSITKLRQTVMVSWSIYVGQQYYSTILSYSSIFVFRTFRQFNKSIYLSIYLSIIY